MKLFLLALPCALLLSPAPAGAQPPPPIQGVTGTIATDGSIEGTSKAAGAVARGVKKILPGSKASDQNPLDALIEGSHVVVRDVAASASASVVEGVVVDVNKKRQQITVRLADKKTQTLRVLGKATADKGDHVIVSLADQATPVTYDFKRVS